MDFVLTFEELQGMFEAKNVDFAAIPEGESMREGTAAGRGFAVDALPKVTPDFTVLFRLSFLSL